MSRDSRPGRLGTSRLDSAQVQRQATLLRLVSITEAFCADRLLGAADANFDVINNKLHLIVWDRATQDATGNWESMQSAFKKWYGVSPDWRPVRILTEARNAIAHGLGHLTRRQRRSVRDVTAKLKELEIAVIGDQLALTESNLSSVTVVCKELIRDVDERMRRVGL